jgi:son of sevenless-like protein
MQVLDQRLNGKEVGAKRMIQTVNQNNPPPIMPKNMKKLKLLDIDVTEFARQLTIIESRLYAKIKPTECLNQTWSKKVPEGEPEPAPNVKALILHSNQMTNWVAEMILQQGDVRRRVVVIKHFIAVADVSTPFARHLTPSHKWTRTYTNPFPRNAVPSTTSRH